MEFGSKPRAWHKNFRMQFERSRLVDCQVRCSYKMSASSEALGVKKPYSIHKRALTIHVHSKSYKTNLRETYSAIS